MIRSVMPDDLTPDEDLIHRIAQADQHAFLLLCDRHAPRVYGLALRMLANAMAVEGVAQDAFLKIRGHGSIQKPDRGSLVAWILTITRPTAPDRL